MRCNKKRSNQWLFRFLFEKNRGLNRQRVSCLNPQNPRLYILPPGVLR